MNYKSISLYLLLGLFIYLVSCAKNEDMNQDPPDPDPIDTTKHDTVPNDTTHIDTNTNTGGSTLAVPTSFVFVNTVIAETEYYEILKSGKQKVSEPYYMRYSKNLLQSSIKDDHFIPYKEIRFVSKDKLTLTYKDSSIVENNEYYVQNGKDIYLKASGYLGTLNTDNSAFDLNLSPYTYSNESNRPMYPRLYLCISYSSDRNKTIDHLATAQGLQTGDTLAVNFSKMAYIKK